METRNHSKNGAIPKSHTSRATILNFRIMKKNLLTIILFVLASTITINCSKEPDDAVDCSDLASKASAAGTTYSLSQTTANCNAYKTAINNFLACPAITAADRAQFQALLPLLVC